MKVYERIAYELSALGVTDCFGMIGEDVAELLVSLQDRGVRYFSARHENNAVAMADGFARTDGSVGVCVISKGPGLLNALNALVTAARGASPLLVIVADTDHDPAGAASRRKGKFLDQQGVLDRVGARVVTLDDASTAGADVVVAYRMAEAGSTVVVNIPDSVFVAEAGEVPSSIDLPQRQTAGKPAPEDIALVADLLETTWAASRPLILAGRGALRADARAALVELGELTGALLATTLLANGMFHGEPYDAGIMGTFSRPAAGELIGRCDVLLSFGAALGLFTTYNGELAPDATVVQFDADPGAFGLYPYTQPELTVVGDAAESARALVAELRRRGHHFDGFRTAEVAARLTGPDSRYLFSDESDERGLDPRSVLTEFEALLPDERMVVTDSGHHMNFESAILHSYDGLSWIYPCDFSSIGAATGVAIGAAIARPERITVLCVGDGGLMMTLAELATAVRYALPLLVLVNNDAAYGSDLQLLDIDESPTEVARTEEISFAAVARALGADGLTVTSLGDVAQLKSWLSDPAGPMVVDYRTTTSVQADALRLFRRLGRQSGR